MAVLTEVSRRQTVTRDSVSITRVLEVEPYSAWGSMVDFLLGGIRLVGGFLYRVPPMGDPYVPWAFAKSVDVEGVGTFQGNTDQTPIVQLVSKNFYRRARLTVQYETIALTQDEVENSGGENSPSEEQEMDLATQSIDVTSQSLTLPNSFFRFKRSPDLSMNTVNVNAVKVIPQMKTVFVRHFVINRPLNAINALIGRVNYSSFRVGTATWPSETLRFDGANTSQKITNLGIKFHEIQYQFSVMPAYDNIATSDEAVDANDPKIIVTPSTTTKAFVGWNRIYRADRGYWDRVVAKDPLTGTYNKQMYDYDNEITQTISGASLTGFKLLFHPGAV